MGIFDNLLKGVKEEAIKASKQSRNPGGRSQMENTYNHFMKTLEESSGIKREDIISMKVKSVERKKR